MTARRLELACALTALALLAGLANEQASLAPAPQPNQAAAQVTGVPIEIASESGQPVISPRACIREVMDAIHTWPYHDLVDWIQRLCFGPQHQASAPRESSAQLACTRARRALRAVPRQVTGCLLD